MAIGARLRHRRSARSKEVLRRPGTRGSGKGNGSTGKVDEFHQSSHATLLPVFAIARLSLGDVGALHQDKRRSNRRFVTRVAAARHHAVADLHVRELDWRRSLQIVLFGRAVRIIRVKPWMTISMSVPKSSVRRMCSR